MKFENFKKAEAKDIPLQKSISLTAKSFSIYLNHELKDLEINPTQLSFLIEIYYKKEINQKKVAANCNIDKGAVARSLRKLEEQGLITREVDEENRRQNIVSITDKGKDTLIKTKEILNKWDLEAYKGINKDDKEKLQKILKKIALNSLEISQKYR